MEWVYTKIYTLKSGIMQSRQTLTGYFIVYAP